MSKIIKSVLVLLLCLVWIIATNFKVAPLNNLGSLLTFGPGLLSVDGKEELAADIKSGRELTIQIDSFGVPYIYSGLDENLAYGLGFMHAKDRYFQMELMSKMVKGELAGLFGPRAVSSDEFWKPYEFDRKAREIMAEYRTDAPEVYAYLTSYSEGVNAYLRDNEINDPLYTFFGSQAGNWKPEYCLMVTWYMSKNLAYYDLHAERQELMEKLTPEQLNLLYPMSPEGLKTILPADWDSSSVAAAPQINFERSDAKTDFLTSDAFTLPTTFTESTEAVGTIVSESFARNAANFGPNARSGFNTDFGSNNWAVNAAKTAAGHALVANDPHLWITLPGPFYETALMGDQIKVYGFTIPGVPVVVSGHNDQTSWGITNGEWDLTDRYLLETKGDSLYRYEGQWRPIEKDAYTIQVKGKGEQEIIVKRTVHGRLIEENGKYYAQKWYPSEKTYSVKALYEMMQAQGWTEFKAALKSYDYPPQNFIYGDVSDTIGIVCAGKLPYKPEGYGGGLLDGTKAPLDHLFVDQQWATSNPERAYLFSANQLPAANGQYFGIHWHKDDYRVEWIDSLLKADDEWTVANIQKMQLDETDVSIEDVRKLMEHRAFGTIHPMLSLINNWTGDMSETSTKAFYYENFRLSIEAEAARYARDELGVQQAPSMRSFVEYLDTYDDESELRQRLVGNILNGVDTLMQAEPDQHDTKYSEKADFFAMNMSFLPGFGFPVTGMGGNKNTISMNAKAHPVFRSVYEMQAGDIRGYTSLAGGQSGKMNSPAYVDQLAAWSKGGYKPTQFSKDPEALENIVQSLKFQQ